MAERKSARTIAAQRIGKLLSQTPLLVACDKGFPDHVVGVVIESLGEASPKPVVEAGRAELALMVPGLGKRDQRQLVKVMWRAMLDQARRA